MLVVLKKTCFRNVTISLQHILKEQKLVLNSVFSHLVFSLIPPFLGEEEVSCCMVNNLNNHKELHKDLATFKKSQAFIICINLTLKF